MTSMHQVKITLDYLEPPIWRRVLIPSRFTLARTATVLLAAMGWHGDHLYAFRIGRTTYRQTEGSVLSRPVDPATVTLAKVAPRGATLRFEYDFGDGWEHDVVVEEIVDVAGGVPRCLDGARACPPEDVGGYPGYEEFVAAVGNPRHRRHRELLEWGGPYDPEQFDLEVFDRYLGRLG